MENNLISRSEKFDTRLSVEPCTEQFFARRITRWGGESISVGFEYYLSGEGWIKNNWLLFFTRFNDIIRCKRKKNHPFDNTQGGAEREKENGSNCLISSPSYLQQPKSSSEKAETTLRMTTKRNVPFLCVIIRDIHALARMFKREIKLI